MVHLFSSAIQVSYPAQGEMVVKFPQQVLAPVLLLVIGIVLAIFAAGLIKSTGFRLKSLLYLFGFLPLIGAIYLMTSSSTLSLSQTTKSVVVVNRAFLLTRQHTYDLGQVDHAEVAQDDGASHAFYLALTSQDRIPIGGGWTPRSGYYQAADAVNLFLNRTRTAQANMPAENESGPSMPSMEELGRRAVSQELAERKKAHP